MQVKANDVSLQVTTKALTLKDDLDIDMLQVKGAAQWDTQACQVSRLYL